MENANVLCHSFEHNGRWFCFDTVTDGIYECDEVAAEVAPLWHRLDDPQVLRPLEAKWGAERVQEALTEIRQLNAAEKALTPKDLKMVHECDCCGPHARPEAYESELGHLQMTLTEQCNLRCEYCPYTTGKVGTRTHSNRELSREHALAAVDFFMARNEKSTLRTISFYGGEALLRFDLIREIVARVRALQDDREVHIHLDTNGVLIDDEVAAFIIEEKLYVQFSLDGPEPIHDRYRKTVGGEGTFARVMAGLDRLLKLDPNSHERIRFNAVVAPPYQVQEVLDFYTDFEPYQKYGIKSPPLATIQWADLHGIEFHPVGWDEPRQLAFQEEWQGIRNRYLEGCRSGKHDELPRALRGMFDAEIAKYHDQRRELATDELFPTGCCRPGQKKIHIKADGSFTVCERCGDNMIIGHVDTGFDMPMIHNLYEKLLAAVGPRCRECWALRHCGLCFIHMSAGWKADGTGQITVPEEVCQQIRDNLEGTLKDYLTLQEAGDQALDWVKNMKVS